LANAFGIEDGNSLATLAPNRSFLRVPTALIIRLKVKDQGDDKPGTSYLIVSKLSNTAACVTDIVKPGKNQNLTAQRLADKASNKPCKKTAGD